MEMIYKEMTIVMPEELSSTDIDNRICNRFTRGTMLTGLGMNLSGLPGEVKAEDNLIS